MNYPHFNDPDPSIFPAAVTLWESYANDLALLAELSMRVVNTKQQISNAVALGERVLVRFHEVRDKLEGLQLRADELAKIVRLADAEKALDRERGRIYDT